MATSITTERAIYAAVTKGLQEEGIEAKHDRSQRTTENRVCNRIAISNHNRNITISITSEGGTHIHVSNKIGQATNIKTGPELADPKFFEKLAELIESLT